jgi:ankyrin repeat protein
MGIRNMNERQQHALDTAFIICAERGDIDLIPCLLRAGANINAKGDAALICAAEGGHTAVVEYLLIMGADPQNNKALFRSVQNGHKETLRALFNWAEQHKPTAGPRPLVTPAP